MTEQLILVAFGAFIGLISGVLGRVIYDSLIKSSKKEVILHGIITELKSIKFQFLITTFQVYMRYGLLVRDKIDWIYENLEDYREKEKISNIMITLERLKQYSDAHLTNLVQANYLISEIEHTAHNFKKNRLLFIEQNLNNLDLFDFDIQYKILHMVKALDRLNQEIDYAYLFYTKTFDALDATDHESVNANYDQSAKNIGRWSCQIAKEITVFIKENERTCNELKIVQ